MVYTVDLFLIKSNYSYKISKRKALVDVKQLVIVREVVKMRRSFTNSKLQSANTCVLLMKLVT